MDIISVYKGFNGNWFTLFPGKLIKMMLCPPVLEAPDWIVIVADAGKQYMCKDFETEAGALTCFTQVIGQELITENSLLEFGFIVGE